jgi:hypothetical protein
LEYLHDDDRYERAEDGKHHDRAEKFEEVAPLHIVAGVEDAAGMEAETAKA